MIATPFIFVIITYKYSINELLRRDFLKKMLFMFAVLIVSAALGSYQVANAEDVDVCYVSENVFTENEDANGINPDINHISGYDKYLYFNEGKYLFDVTSAIENGENENVIQFGQIFNNLSKDYTESPRRTIRALTKAFSYGNWCGKGNNGKTPIDRLDRACKAHDLCYEKKGWSSKSCNREFVNELKRIKGPNRDYQTLNVYGRLYLDAAIALFSKFM